MVRTRGYLRLGHGLQTLRWKRARVRTRGYLRLGHGLLSLRWKQARVSTRGVVGLGDGLLLPRRIPFMVRTRDAVKIVRILPPQMRPLRPAPSSWILVSILMLP